MRSAERAMRNEEPKADGPAAGTRNARLSACVFYGVILAGVLVGTVACAAAGWAYLEFGDRKPTGRRIWEGDAESFVIPISVMVGATFGGLAGVSAAVLLDRANGPRHSREPPSEPKA